MAYEKGSHVKVRGVLSRKLTILFVVSTFCLSAPGCAKERQWTEEVDLGEGKAIEIERYVKFAESNSSSGDAFSSTESESTLKFGSQFAELPTCSVPLAPILLYHAAAITEWVIVATTSNCDTWYSRGGPEPLYWEYRLKAGKWVEGPLSEASIDQWTNLFFDYEPALSASKISASLKKNVFKQQPFAKDYLSIKDIKKTTMRETLNS